ncbi:MAG: hydroxysqualene dehydroxylase HpnE [Rhodospirillaceae bacterium]|nr:hydroxysqualene dehydroxylase HpnE [Rhodospirillaceae bacterium]
MSRDAPTAWIIGAGLAGLSTAIELVRRGWRVTVLETAGQAGGRCRSYHDRHLDRWVDNGNHLLLSGNRSAMRFLQTVGATDSLIEVVPARLPFVDLKSGEKWVIRPNSGPLPWWIFSAARRTPGTETAHHLSAVRLARAGERTVSALFSDTDGTARQRLYRRFWEPMAVAVLNTAAEQGAARLLWPLMTEIFFRGETAFRPCIARNGLTESFVAPALDWLGENGAEIRFNNRVRTLQFGEQGIAALSLGDSVVSVGAQDAVICATTPAVAADLVPALKVPTEYCPVVNLHFVTPEPVTLPENLPLLGLVGGTAQWLFVRGDILSVTISAGHREAEMPHDQVAKTVWQEICRAVSLDGPVPPVRVVTEKRATIAQTPAQNRLRPSARSSFPNLYLAGDWTATGLPSTIEGAIRSGERAAVAVGVPSRQRPCS